MKITNEVLFEKRTTISKKQAHKMNYLKEINAFHKQQETTPLLPGAASIYIFFNVTHPEDLARPCPFEIAATINRLRTLVLVIEL